MEGLIFRILQYFGQLSLNTIITVGNQRRPQLLTHMCEAYITSINLDYH